MTNNTEVAQAYFRAYQLHDAQRMCDLLAPDAVFSDLAFPSLTGERLRLMWRWFCAKTATRGPVDVPEFTIVGTEGSQVRVRYRVVYRLGERRVDYWIRAALTIRGGQIVAQTDRLGVPKWRFAWMAAGFPKCLAAYTRKFDKKLQERMRTALNDAEAAARAAAAQ